MVSSDYTFQPSTPLYSPMIFGAESQYLPKYLELQIMTFSRTIFNFMMLVVIVLKFLKKKFNPTSIIMLQLCFIDLIGCSIQAPVVSYALVSEIDNYIPIFRYSFTDM